jgi:hypothetical protein
MSTIALIDMRLKIPGESIGMVVSTHETTRAAFKANEAFQKRMRESGVKDHVPTKIVTLKVRLGDGEHVNPGRALVSRGGKVRIGVKELVQHKGRDVVVNGGTWYGRWKELYEYPTPLDSVHCRRRHVGVGFLCKILSLRVRSKKGGASRQPLRHPILAHSDVRPEITSRRWFRGVA